MSAYSTGRTRPFTGQQYLDSLRDGREIYIYGERVKDVTTHPAVPQHRADDRAALRRAA
jgi:aromatic ring hydroxylase